jgi:hypothetical protein
MSVSSRKTGTEEKNLSPRLILKHGQERVMVERQRSYNVSGTTIINLQ